MTRLQKLTIKLIEHSLTDFLELNGGILTFQIRKNIDATKRGNYADMKIRIMDLDDEYIKKPVFEGHNILFLNDKNIWEDNMGKEIIYHYQQCSILPVFMSMILIDGRIALNMKKLISMLECFDISDEEILNKRELESIGKYKYTHTQDEYFLSNNNGQQDYFRQLKKILQEIYL